MVKKKDLIAIACYRRMRAQQCHSSQPMASPGRTPQRPNQSSWVKVTVTDKASWDGLKDVASREIMKSIERKEN